LQRLLQRRELFRRHVRAGDRALDAARTTVSGVFQLVTRVRGEAPERRKAASAVII